MTTRIANKLHLFQNREIVNQTQEEASKNKLSQNRRKFVENITGEGYRLIK